MKFSSTNLIVAGAALAAALPHQDSVARRMQKGLQIPAHWGSQKPYTPGFRDPFDNAVDPIQSKLDPKPWRNGKGASVLGPYNPERSRQSPDMIRPPSTDHGDVENMRWSFTDSHTRIEVSLVLQLISERSDRFANTSRRKAAGQDRQPFASSPAASSLLV